MSVSIVATNFFCLKQAGLSLSLRQLRLRQFLNIFSRAAEVGGFRLVSNLLIYGATRGPVLWAVWLGADVNLDELALAVALGEVVMQFGLIPVHRQYTKWCRDKPEKLVDLRQGAISAAALGSLLAFASLTLCYLLIQTGFAPPQLERPAVLYSALLFFSLLPAFWLIRYLLWARNIFSWELVVGSALIFLLMSAVAIVEDVSLLFLLSSSALLLICVLFLSRARGYFLTTSTA